MHIPDGFLSEPVWISLSGISAAAVVYSANKYPKKNDEKRIPFLSTSAAFIFAAQMINFPVAGGTSGHFLGAAAASILFGPFTGITLMALVIIIQAFLFGDGGITALGTNIFNMAVVASISGYLIYKYLFKYTSKKKISSAVAAFFSIIIASLFCTFELYFSGTVPFKPAAITMSGIHSIIGLAEGLITFFIIETLQRSRPDLLKIEKI